MVFQAAQVALRLSQPFEPTIEPGVFSPYFFADLTFPNSNLALGVYHPSTAPMRHIPSKLFQSKWRTTLVLTSHRVDERPCTANDFGEPALAVHQDATCPRQVFPK
ncbi:hypothetical protein EV1_023778 [Malus domestica]